MYNEKSDTVKLAHSSKKSERKKYTHKNSKVEPDVILPKIPLILSHESISSPKIHEKVTTNYDSIGISDVPEESAQLKNDDIIDAKKNEETFIMDDKAINSNDTQKYEEKEIQKVEKNVMNQVQNSLLELINTNYKGSHITILVKGIEGLISGEVVFELDGVLVLKHQNIIVYINQELIVAFY